MSRIWFVRAAFRLLPVLLVLCLPLPGFGADDELPDGLGLVPADGSGFLSVRIGQLYRSDATKAFREKLAKAQPDFQKQFAKEVGIALTQMDRVTLVLGDSPEGPPLLILSTSEPLDKEKVKAAILRKFEEKKHAGKTYFARKLDEKREKSLPRYVPAVYFVSERILVQAPVGQMEQFLDRMGKKAGKGPLSPALSRAGKEPLVVALNLPGPFFQAAKKKAPDKGKELLVPLGANPGVVTLVGDKNIRVKANLTFADKEGVTEAEKALKSLKDLVLSQIAKGREELGRELKREKADEFGRWFMGRAREFLDKVDEGIKGAKVERKDSTLVVTFTIKATAADTLIMGSASFFLAVPPETAPAERPGKTKANKP